MELTVKELNDLKKDFHDSSVHMKKEIVENDEAVVFIGGTKSGKSTLINYLIGNELKAESLGQFQPVKLFKVDINSSGPTIGLGPSSETTIPTRWISKELKGLALFDAPGFGDNRTPVQDIKNAFALYQLFQNIKSLKIALVVDIQYIFNDDVKPFLSVLVAVENLLGHRMRDCFSSILIIFTKVPEVNEDDFPVNIQFVNDMLSYKFLESSLHMSSTSKGFVKYLTENNQQIALFKRAKPGPVTSEIEVGVFQVIRNSKPIEQGTLEQISPSVSDDAKTLLFKSRENLCSMTIYSKIDDIVTEINDKRMYNLEMDSNDKESENKMKENLRKLEGLQKQLSVAIKESDFYKKVKILQSLDDEIKNCVENDALLEGIELKEFVDKLLGFQESKESVLQLQTVITSWVSRIEEFIAFIRMKLGEITMDKYNEFLAEERECHEEKLRQWKEELSSVKKEIEKINKSHLAKLKDFVKSFLSIRICNGSVDPEGKKETIFMSNFPSTSCNQKQLTQNCEEQLTQEACFDENIVTTTYNQILSLITES